MSSNEVCNIDDLKNGLPGITKAWGELLTEASVVCFESQRHLSGVDVKITGIDDHIVKFFWNIMVSKQTLDSWADEQELTEYGACGVAILLIMKLTEYTIIQRAVKGTGIDYWLGYKDDEIPFQNAARLEVSGIMSNSENKVKARVKKKIEQTNLSDGKLPAYIAVVEFSKPLSYLVKK